MASRSQRIGPKRWGLTKPLPRATLLARPSLPRLGMRVALGMQVLLQNFWTRRRSCARREFYNGGGPWHGFDTRSYISSKEASKL